MEWFTAHKPKTLLRLGIWKPKVTAHVTQPALPLHNPVVNRILFTFSLVMAPQTSRLSASRY
jgi:uncharacterized protein YhdP